MIETMETFKDLSIQEMIGNPSVQVGSRPINAEVKLSSSKIYV